MSADLDEANKWACGLPRYQFEYVLAIRNSGLDAAANKADALIKNCALRGLSHGDTAAEVYHAIRDLKS